MIIKIAIFDTELEWNCHRICRFAVKQILMMMYKDTSFYDADFWIRLNHKEMVVWRIKQAGKDLDVWFNDSIF